MKIWVTEKFYRKYFSFSSWIFYEVISNGNEKNSSNGKKKWIASRKLCNALSAKMKSIITFIEIK